MANQVVVEVVLEGAEEASRGLGKIGETSAAMADRFAEGNEKLGEGLGSLVGNVEELGGAFKELGSTVGNTSKMSAASFGALVPAIGAVVAAGFALYETFLNISGAAQDAEDRAEAMAAAAGDLESKLEALSENGIVPTTKDLRAFTKATIQAQLAKELLQKKIENAEKSFTGLTKAQDEATAAQKRYAKGNIGDVLLESIGYHTSYKTALDNVKEAEKEFNKTLDSIIPVQEKVNKLVAEAAKQGKALEDQSAEATIGRIKELAAKEQSISLARAEIETSDKALKKRQLEIEQNKQLLELTIDRNKEDAKALREIEKQTQARLDAALSGEKQEDIIRRQYAKRAQELDKETNDKRVENRRKATRLKKPIILEDLAAERMLQRELEMIRALELQSLEINGADQLELIRLRYEDELKLAEDNHNLITIARMRRQNAEDRIVQEDIRRSEEAIQNRKLLAIESAEFDLSLTADSTSKKLDLLTLRYEKERQLAGDNAEMITEINRREELERSRIQEEAISARYVQLEELGKQLAAAGAEAAYASIVAGEGFKDSIGQSILALGQQAAVKALFQTGESIALAATGNLVAAGAALKAAAVYGTVATVAGVTASKLGVGGGGGGGASASPSGLPQTSTAPQREQAEERQVVYNINFGGSVIYDSKTAAEQAFANRITQLQNRTPRGGVRPRPRA